VRGAISASEAALVIRPQSLQRRWLLTVMGLITAGLALEVGVSLFINVQNAMYGARAWLANGSKGAVATSVHAMFARLEAIGAGLKTREGVTEAVTAKDLAAIDAELNRTAPTLKLHALIAPPEPALAESDETGCDGVGVPFGPRSIVWCGTVPVVMAQVTLPGTANRLFLTQPLGQQWVDELKMLSLNEVVLWGRDGAVASTFELATGGRSTTSFDKVAPEFLARGPERFERLTIDLSGPYAGYFPEQVQDQYAVQLSSNGKRHLEVFALSSPLDAELGPADLRVVLAVPADLMMLGPKVSAAGLTFTGILLIIALAFVARRLIASFSRPLVSLERAAKKAAESGGRFEAHLDDSGSIELSSLTRSFESMTQRAAQSEKMAAIGTLAGGIAHEINNPLGVILGFAQGLERRVRDGDPLRMPVTSIVRESLRCKALVQELLTFSRTSKVTDALVDVADVVRSSVVLLEARAKMQGVQLSTGVEPLLPFVKGSRTQLQQVLVNLGTNALDAMKDQGGTLSVRVAAKDGGVVLEVADTGHGIPTDIRGRVFEPFFTTKGVGEGTGLGLSLVYQIVEQHHGHVDVASSGPTGTVMRVRLPAFVPEAKA
jgi:signal transduction histidine kinase